MYFVQKYIETGLNFSHEQKYFFLFRNFVTNLLLVYQFVQCNKKFHIIQFYRFFKFIKFFIRSVTQSNFFPCRKLGAKLECHDENVFLKADRALSKLNFLFHLKSKTNSVTLKACNSHLEYYKIDLNISIKLQEIKLNVCEKFKTKCEAWRSNISECETRQFYRASWARSNLLAAHDKYVPTKRAGFFYLGTRRKKSNYYSRLSSILLKHRT